MRLVWPRQKGQGGHLAEAVMGPLGAIGLEPRLGDLAHLLEGVEEIDVENLKHRGRGRSTVGSRESRQQAAARAGEAYRPTRAFRGSASPGRFGRTVGSAHGQDVGGTALIEVSVEP